VLLTGRRRHTSGGSDGSRNGTSGSSSPINNTPYNSGKFNNICIFKVKLVFTVFFGARRCMYDLNLFNACSACVW
jgi:hypothetical protein